VSLTNNDEKLRMRRSLLSLQLVENFKCEQFDNFAKNTFVKAFSIFLLTFGSCSIALAQNEMLIDSLQRRLKTSSREERFSLLNSIGWEYRFSYPDSTINYSQRAYDLGKRLKLNKDLAKPLNFIGVATNYKGDRLKAFEYYQQALHVAEEQNDSLQLAYTNNNIGRLLFEQGVIPKSFTYFVKALKLFKQSSDSSGIAYVKQSLANLHRLQKNYDKSESEHLEALAIRLRLKVARDIMSAYVQLGVLFQESGQLDKSNYYFLKGDSVGHKTNDHINLAEIKVLLAENYLAENKLREACIIGEEGFGIIKQNNNARMLPRALLVMGKISAAKKLYAEARALFSEALEVSKNTKSSAHQIESYFQLAELAKKTGNKQAEIQYMNDYLIMKDSIEDLELARQVERLQFELQIETKERELELLKLKQANTEILVSRQRRGNMLLLAISVSLIITAIISWQISKKRKLLNQKLALQNQQITGHQLEIDKQNEILSKRNQMLSDLNEEKNTLMSIVAHDLKAPLNRIAGLASLLKMTGKLTSQQQDYIQMMTDATQAGSSLITDLLDVHEMEEEDYSSTFVDVDLTNLVLERINYFQAIAIAKGIKLKYESNGAVTFFSEPTYLDRILDNLLSNAIKFSNPGTTVDVSLRTVERQAVISVKDQGLGFSESDKPLLYKKFKRLSARPTASESSNGLGLAIVKTLVDRLEGKIELISEVRKGSEFIITLPPLSERSASVSQNELAASKSY
jgi:signal transduction histidine kinase